MLRLPILFVLFLPLWDLPALAADNQLTPAEEKADWKLLFNGKNHDGWKCNNGKPIATPIEDGCLVPYKSGGYIIIYEQPFENFVFKCDVKWEAERCNSGIFVRVEDPGNPVHTGFEIQVMSGQGTGKHQFGAIYDLVPNSVAAGNDTGEWNQVEIDCRDSRIKVKLNGKLVSAIDTEKFDQPGLCPDGKQHKYKLDGKPRAVKDFAKKGYLGFQDHGQKVWYKNVKILALP